MTCRAIRDEFDLGLRFSGQFDTGTPAPLALRNLLDRFEGFGMKPGEMFPVVDILPDAFQRGPYLAVIHRGDDQIGISLD